MRKSIVLKLKKIFKEANEWSLDNRNNIKESKGDVWGIYGNTDFKLWHDALNYVNTLIEKDEEINYSDIKEEAIKVKDKILSNIENEVSDLTFKSEEDLQLENHRPRYWHSTDRGEEFVSSFGGCHYTEEEIQKDIKKYNRRRF